MTLALGRTRARLGQRAMHVRTRRSRWARSRRSPPSPRSTSACRASPSAACSTGHRAVERSRGVPGPAGRDAEDFTVRLDRLDERKREHHPAPRERPGHGTEERPSMQDERVIHHVRSQDPAQVRFDELVRAMDEDRFFVDDAVKQLVADGLLYRHGDFVLANESRRAIRRAHS
jgi:hypothetical protein